MTREDTIDFATSTLNIISDIGIGIIIGYGVAAVVPLAGLGLLKKICVYTGTVCLANKVTNDIRSSNEIMINSVVDIVESDSISET